MKIAMIASEAAPYIKTGGLGDVMQALPAELSRLRGNEVYLFLPYYRRIKQNESLPVEFVSSLYIPCSFRESYVGIFKLKSRRKKLQVYFIDNDYYFGSRSTVYGDFDDGERFAYFSKAALEALHHLQLQPEVLHCHDWQAAMSAVYSKTLYQECFPGLKTVFTIHNVEYQGWADSDFFTDVLGLPEFFRGHLTFDGRINMMKGAIELADTVSTVSESYARELCYPYYAHRLERVLQNAGPVGITNGIDTGVFDPETDPALVTNYSAEALPGKWENKLALRQELGLRTDTDAPILAMVSRLAGHKGIDLLCYIGNRLLEQEVQLVIVGTGEKQYELALSAMAHQHPGKVAVRLAFDPALASRVYAGADIYLMPSKSEPCGLSQLIAMRYGTIPVVASTGGLRDTVPPYNPETKEGRGFTFQSYNADDFKDAIDRAVNLYYNNRSQWNALAKADMQCDFSWKKPAEEYMRLYERLISL